MSAATPASGQPAPGGAAGEFEAALARLGQREPLARMLLTALAWARGPGLPRGGVWLPVALALRPDGAPVQRNPTGRDVRWLLGVMRAYLVADNGPGGRRAYRIGDAAVAAHLRGETRGGEPGDDAAGNGATRGDADAQERRARAEQRITTALLGTVPGAEHGRDWARADPYLRAYLACHAAGAGPGTFAALIRDPGFLAVADPDTLIPLMSVASPQLRDLVRAYRRASPLLGADARGNAAHLAEAARGLAGGGVATDGVRPRYRTRLASLRRDDSLLTLTGHTAMVYSVAFGTTPGGRLLLASGSDDGSVRIWDPYTGTPTLPPITGHGDLASGPGVAPWGQTMKPSETYWTTGEEVEALAFGTTRDGRLLLATAGCDRTVRVWDPLTGEPAGDPLTGHTGRVWHVAAARAPGRRLLLASGSDDCTVRVWDAQTLEAVGGPLTGHTEQVVMVALGTAGGRFLLASASSDCTVRRWDPLTGEPFGEPLTGHTAPVFTAVFGTAPDGRTLLATCGEDTTIRLWDPLTGEPFGEPLTGHTDRVDGVAFATAPDGRWLMASCSRDQTVRLWDPLACTGVGEPLTGHTSWVFSLALSTAPEGLLLLATGSADTTIRVWDALDAAAPRAPAGGHSRWVTSAAFGTPGGGRPLLLAAGSGEGTVGVWDPLTGRRAGPPLRAAPRDVSAVAYGTDTVGRLLLAAGSADGTVRVWDAATGRPATEPFPAHRGGVRAVAFGTSRGGRLLLATGGTDRTARLWDPFTGTPACEPLTGHQGWVDALAFGTGPAGQLLLATGGGDGTVRLWHALSGHPAGPPLRDRAGGVRALATVFRRGRLLLAAGGDDPTIRLWDALAGKPAGKPFTGHTKWISSLAFTATPGGRPLLASGSGDGTVRLWQPGRGGCLTTLRRGSAVRCVAAAGLTLALGDDNGLTVVEVAEDELGRPPRSRRPRRGPVPAGTGVCRGRPARRG